jgi:ABC-type polysaccharide/polyol phosphate transport system ATPase subunit
LAKDSGDDVNPVVEVINASVSYKIRHGASPTLKETALNALKRRPHDLEIRALNEISFDIFPGETLAVIGGNGAGKSTLIKLLARVLPPSEGRVIIRGSVSPMIELGAGFNPELTGKENILLYGTLLGRRTKDLEANSSRIAEWAGLQDFINLPLRTYSSGMIARLAFSIATDYVSDLILIDEVLSVGDSEFQTKSKSRMNELLESGASVILVTHSLETVKSLATKAMWISRGNIMRYGSPTEVIDAYENA